jgi:hypothetical protein
MSQEGSMEVDIAQGKCSRVVRLRFQPTVQKELPVLYDHIGEDDMAVKEIAKELTDLEHCLTRYARSRQPREKSVHHNQVIIVIQSPGQAPEA